MSVLEIQVAVSLSLSVSLFYLSEAAAELSTALDSKLKLTQRLLRAEVVTGGAAPEGAHTSPAKKELTVVEVPQAGHPLSRQYHMFTGPPSVASHHEASS